MQIGVDAFGIDHVPFDGPLVRFIDTLIEGKNRIGSHTTVTVDKDWELLDYMLRGYEALYPVHAKEFADHMKTWRRLATRHGASKEGSAMIQHQLEIPQKII